MLFNYKATTKDNQPQAGSIDAPNVDLAIASLQRRGLVILDIESTEKTAWWQTAVPFMNRVKMKDIVLLSRQISTLFEAKVSALATFKLLAAEATNVSLRSALLEVADDINAGVLISTALNKHPHIFSAFYVNMVKSGEESGKLAESFSYLAAYLERSHTLVSKAKNALIYPAFVILSFIGVMILMLVFVIPKLSTIIQETGQDIPIYTKIVIGISQFFVDYGILLSVLLIALIFFLFRYIKTDAGRDRLSGFKLSVPVVNALYQKLYLSRISDNLATMLTSGISMVRALEITAEVVDNKVYEKILRETSEAVKSGSQISTIFFKYPEIPSIMIQMIKVGEETGKLGFILETLSRFYQREVNNAVETLVDLIEPAMIVLLGVGVGVLLTSVLVPIYNLASGF
ncbi:MAG: type II secretion system F family protein [Patescibacteria group bacterium]|nr:type II secretion system F family protein [Patescibacteria group bacterium]